MKNKNLKKVQKCQRRPVCHQNNSERMRIALKSCNAADKSWNRYVVSIGLSVASAKLQSTSFKKFIALVPIGPNDSKAKGTKWCVVKILTYLASFLVAASSAAAVYERLRHPTQPICQLAKAC